MKKSQSRDSGGSTRLSSPLVRGGGSIVPRETRCTMDGVMSGILYVYCTVLYCIPSAFVGMLASDRTWAP